MAVQNAQFEFQKASDHDLAQKLWMLGHIPLKHYMCLAMFANMPSVIERMQENCANVLFKVVRISYPYSRLVESL